MHRTLYLTLIAAKIGLWPLQLLYYFTAQCLTGALSSLEALISKHKLGCRAPFDRVTTQWLAAKCQALGLKME